MALGLDYTVDCGDRCLHPWRDLGTLLGVEGAFPKVVGHSLGDSTPQCRWGTFRLLLFPMSA